MTDLKTLIYVIEQRISIAERNNQAFVDLPYDTVGAVLAMLKEQEAVVHCKDCKHATMTADGKMCKYCEMDTDDFGYQRNVYHDADWFCADGDSKEGGEMG